VAKRLVFSQHKIPDDTNSNDETNKSHEYIDQQSQHRNDKSNGDYNEDHDDDDRLKVKLMHRGDDDNNNNNKGCARLYVV